jgi:hypothetical protein
METKYIDAAKTAFQKEVVKHVKKISTECWPWSVPNAVYDLVKLVSAAIKLGGLDKETSKEFTEDDVKALGEKLEMFRRLEMKAETQEILLSALAEHGIVVVIPEPTLAAK